jgi:hypothetical protein
MARKVSRNQDGIDQLKSLMTIVSLVMASQHLAAGWLRTGLSINFAQFKYQSFTHRIST